MNCWTQHSIMCRENDQDACKASNDNINTTNLFFSSNADNVNRLDWINIRSPNDIELQRAHAWNSSLFQLCTTLPGRRARCRGSFAFGDSLLQECIPCLVVHFCIQPVIFRGLVTFGFSCRGRNCFFHRWRLSNRLFQHRLWRRCPPLWEITFVNQIWDLAAKSIPVIKCEFDKAMCVFHWRIEVKFGSRLGTNAYSATIGFLIQTFKIPSRAVVVCVFSFQDSFCRSPHCIWVVIWQVEFLRGGQTFPTRRSSIRSSVSQCCPGSFFGWRLCLGVCRL